MPQKNQDTPPKAPYAKPQVSLMTLLRPYTLLISILVILTIVSSALNLAVPKIIASAIDTYTNGDFALTHLIIEFLIVAALIFIFTYLQNIAQVYASERVARD